MKFLNDFKNLFAIVGVVSLIFWTCASESTSDTTNVNPPQQITEGYGKYQVSTQGTSMVILNTETGVLKSYYFVHSNTQLPELSTNGEWFEGTNYFDPGSGSLTVNH
jgi:hypothetical protein